MQALQADLLCRDPAQRQRCIDDPLMHDTGTLEGLAGMLDRMGALGQGRVRVDGARSLWVGHGTADGICEFEATRRWVEGSCGVADKTFKVYEGWFHQCEFAK